MRGNLAYAISLAAPPDRTLDASFDLTNESIALIAHDAMKERMLALAERHFDLLDRLAMRCATGTTGGLLNQLAQRIKGKDAGRRGTAHGAADEHYDYSSFSNFLDK